MLARRTREVGRWRRGASQLVDLPNHKRPAPLAIGGAQRFAHSTLGSVTVSAWNGADELKVRHGSNVFVLTPASPTATLPAGAIPMGGVEWTPARTAGSGAWQNPTVQLTHTCPTTAPTAEPVAQGYALSLATLDSAVSAATGGTGIPFLVTTGSANTWPVYAVRVVNTGAPPGVGVSHKLLVELFGTHGRMTLPLVATGVNAWSLDVDYSGLSLHGTVTKGTSGLTLSLASGTFGEGSSPLVLQATNLTLPPYPTGTMNP